MPTAQARAHVLGASEQESVRPHGPPSPRAQTTKAVRQAPHLAIYRVLCWGRKREAKTLERPWHGGRDGAPLGPTMATRLPMSMPMFRFCRPKSSRPGYLKSASRSCPHRRLVRHPSRAVESRAHACNFFLEICGQDWKQDWKHVSPAAQQYDWCHCGRLLPLLAMAYLSKKPSRCPSPVPTPQNL